MCGTEIKEKSANRSEDRLSKPVYRFWTVPSISHLPDKPKCTTYFYKNLAKRHNYI